jgi:N-acetylmuramoyl-L-alanine amidase
LSCYKHDQLRERLARRIAGIAVAAALLGGNPSLAGKLPNAKAIPRAEEPLVCIDPGHPSEISAGTRGKTGLTEREVNWRVAVKLKRLLEADGVKTVMTKSSEGEFVTNRRRAEIANDAHAALLLRLHCDAGDATGAALFYPDRQGRSGGTTGPSREVIAESRAAANAFHPAMMAVLRPTLKDRGIRGDSQTKVGGKKGALVGSIFSQVPTLLVEMLDLTVSHDERIAATEKGRNLLAKGLERGVLAVLKAAKETSASRAAP